MQNRRTKGASYGHHVGDEPQNAASEMIRAVYPMFGRLADATPGDLQETHELFAEGFLREDRRRFITVPTVGVKGLFESFQAYWDLGVGAPTFTVAEVHAVRGDRLLLFRGRAEFAEGQATESLVLVAYSAEMRAARAVLFDLDDLDGALDELERLHAGIEADGGSPPVDAHP